jgi:hypothetical protein
VSTVKLTVVPHNQDEVGWLDKTLPPNPNRDINNDGAVDILDILNAALQFEETA